MILLAAALAVAACSKDEPTPVPTPAVSSNTTAGAPAAGVNQPSPANGVNRTSGATDSGAGTATETGSTPQFKIVSHDPKTGAEFVEEPPPLLDLKPIGWKAFDDTYNEVKNVYFETLNSGGKIPVSTFKTLLNQLDKLAADTTPGWKETLVMRQSVQRTAHDVFKTVEKEKKMPDAVRISAMLSIIQMMPSITNTPGYTGPGTYSDQWARISEGMFMVARKLNREIKLPEPQSQGAPPAAPGPGVR
jgi:hypothetical protein